MTNVHYLRNQLSMAADCIRRGLDALEAEPAAEPSPAAADQLGQPSPLEPALKALGLAECTPQEKLWIALTARVETLTRILLELSPDVCAKHDLFPF